MHKRSTLLFLSLGLLFAAGVACSNEHLRFCEETSQALCERCYRCAADEASAAKLCGMQAGQKQSDCQRVLEHVCEANDSAFSSESGASCRDRVENLSCEQLAKDRFPEQCRRLL